MSKEQRVSLEELKQTLDEAPWAWLKPHSDRGAVVIVHPSLEILDVGFEIAADHKDKVEAWIKQTLLTKPTLEQLNEWDTKPEKKFMCLVVKPHVLIQEIQVH